MDRLKKYISIIAFLLQAFVCADTVIDNGIGGYTGPNGFSEIFHTNSGGHKIIRDAANNLHATYIDRQGNNYRLIYRRKLNGAATWSTNILRTVDPSFFEYVRYPSIAVSGTNVYIVYATRVTNTSLTIHLMRSTNGGDSFIQSDVHSLAGISMNNENHFTDIKVDSAGNLHLVFVRSVGGSYRLEYLYGTGNGTVWNQHKSNFAVGEDALYPYLEADNAGGIYLAFEILESTSPWRFRSEVWRRTAAGTWSRIVNLPAGTGRSRQPTVLYDAINNRLHLAYVRQEDAGNPTLMYSVRNSANGALISEINVLNNTALYAPKLGLTETTNIPVIQYTASNGSNFEIYQVSKMSNNQFSAAYTVSDIAGNNVLSDLVTEIIGDQPDVLWFNTSGSVVYELFEDRIAPFAPVAPVVTWQDKGINSEDIQSVSATAAAIPEGATQFYYDWSGGGVVDSGYGVSLFDTVADVVEDNQNVTCLLVARDAAGNVSLPGASASVAIADRTPPDASNTMLSGVSIGGGVAQWNIVPDSVEGDATGWQYKIIGGGQAYYYDSSTGGSWVATTIGAILPTNNYIAGNPPAFTNFADTVTNVSLQVIGRDGQSNFKDFNNPDVVNGVLGVVVPQIEVTEPSVARSVSDNLAIGWVLTDVINVGTVRIYYDNNTNNSDGMTLIGTYSTNSPPGFIWDIPSSVAAGTYYIYAEVQNSLGTDSDYSDVSFTIDRPLPLGNLPPQFVFVEPNGLADEALNHVVISWLDEDSDDDADIDLYYTTVGPGTNVGGVGIVSNLSEDDETDSYFWNLPAFAAGTQVYVYAIIDDGTNVPITVYNHNPITILGGGDNSPPAIIVTEPNSLSETAVGNIYNIGFDFANEENEIVTIRLYYDSDNIEGGETIIANIAYPAVARPAAVSDTYAWNFSTIPAGLYYIKAEIEDAQGTIRYDYSGGTIWVFDSTNYSFVFTEPDGHDDTAENFFTLSWTDDYLGEDATITLYYDSDTSGFDGTVIVAGLSEDDEVDGFVWNMSALPNGTYYVYAKMVGSAGAVNVYCLNPIVKSNLPSHGPPAILVIEPDGVADAIVNESFTIYWEDYYSVGDTPIINLYYDTNTVTSDGMTLITANIDATSAIDSYIWNVSGISAGDYFIYAEIVSGIYTRGDYSSGALNTSLLSNNGGTNESVWSFPNPFKPLAGEEATIVFNSDTSETVKVCIYNMKGERVWHENVYVFANSEASVIWDGMDSFRRVAANGVYLILVVHENNKIEKGRLTILD